MGYATVGQVAAEVVMEVVTEGCTAARQAAEIQIQQVVEVP